MQVQRGHGSSGQALREIVTKIRLVTLDWIIYIWFAPPDPENGSGDCPLFCKLCRTEPNEKTTKPRTFMPGNFKPREFVAHRPPVSQPHLRIVRQLATSR